MSFVFSPEQVLAAANTKTVKLKKRSRKTVGDILSNIKKTDDKRSTKLSFSGNKIELEDEAKNRNLKAIKPPNSKRFMRESNQEISRLEVVVDKSIEQLHRLIQKYQRSSNRGELWLRQGELYVEKARLVEQRLFNEYDRKIELYEKKKLRRKPKIDLKASKDYYRRAEKLYKWFISDFKNDPKMDQALFFLGYINFELGKKGEGEHFYSLLTKKYPRSNYVSETHFALGEYYFDRDDWKSALTEYNRVIKYKNSRLFSFAYYKRAWCLYRIGIAGKAIKSLEKVIIRARQAKRDGVKASDGRIRLATEALRDIVLFYSESGDYRKAQKYFRVLAGSKPSEKMSENLAYLYSAKGKLQEASYVFKSLISKDPTGPESYEYQKQIVLNYSNAGNRKFFKTELIRWIKDYGPDSAWYRANQTNQELIAKSSSTREKVLRVDALKWHQVYQNTRSESAVAEALAGYELYFDYFEKSPSAHEMFFYAGELMFELKSYKKSSLYYQKSVETAAVGSGKFLKKASLNRLVSMERSLPDTKNMEAKVKGTQAVTMPEIVREFVLAGQDHINRFPNDESSVEVRFRVARILYLYNLLDKAELYFKQVVQMAPKSKYAEYSANLLLDIYNLREDYAGMARVGNEILAVKGFQNAQLTNDIQDIVEKAAFNEAQSFEKKGDYEKAAESFAKFAKKYSGSSLATSALYNSGVNYERSGNILAAIPIYSRVIQRPGKDDGDLVKKARLLQANLYEKTGNLEKAAELYVGYANSYPQDKLRSDLYFNSAIIYSGAGKHKTASSIFNKYYELNKKNANGIQALYYLGKEQEKLGNRKSAIAYYRIYLNSVKPAGDQYAETAYNMAQLYDQERDYGKADFWYKKIVNEVRGNNRVNYYKAAARLELTLDMYKKFVSVKLPKDTRKQQKIVQSQLVNLEKLNAEFASIVKMNSGEQAISSLIWSGKAYEYMGNSIKTAPKPAGLNADQIKQYDEQISAITSPMFQTAVENFEAAVEKSFELDLYSRDISLAFEKLSEVKPEKYPYWNFEASRSEQIDDQGDFR